MSNKQNHDLNDLDSCFRILTTQNQPQEIFVPTTVQFKINNLTQVNYQKFKATINGVLCISFLIFTQNKLLQEFLLSKLYWSQSQQGQLKQYGRRKKIQRLNNANFIPILFGQDTNIKLPTTRIQQHDIEAYTQDIWYNKTKNGTKIQIKGKRIIHVIRKEFVAQIKPYNSFLKKFMVPFVYTDIQLSLQLDSMAVIQEENKDKNNQINKYNQYNQYIKKISFNVLRIQQPFQKYQKGNFQDIYEQPSDQKMVKLMKPMITHSNNQNFGKFGIKFQYLQGYSHDQKNSTIKQAFFDQDPSCKRFKPFKYVTFKIPIYRQVTTDILTIFLPIFLLGFINIYLYFQNSQILGRIINIASIMIAYATILPIIRQNIPDASTITLIDLIIYLQLGCTLVFLFDSGKFLTYFDQYDSTNPQDLYFNNYKQWQNGFYLYTLIINIICALVTIFITVKHKIFVTKRSNFSSSDRSKFLINDENNWNLTLVQQRCFGRYFKGFKPILYKLNQK